MFIFILQFEFLQGLQFSRVKITRVDIQESIQSKFTQVQKVPLLFQVHITLAINGKYTLVPRFARHSKAEIPILQFAFNLYSLLFMVKKEHILVLQELKCPFFQVLFLPQSVFIPKLPKITREVIQEHIIAIIKNIIPCFQVQQLFTTQEQFKSIVKTIIFIQIEANILEHILTIKGVM